MISPKGVGEAWRQKLTEGGYEHAVSTPEECVKLKKPPRVWRRILREINLNIADSKDKNILEIGCGGGKHLVPFLLNGWRALGIDVSGEVLNRAKDYLSSIETICGARLIVSLIEKDFFDFENEEKFDIVFHAGVIEHFLNDNERLSFLEKMYSFTKPGGYVVSIVPSGIHPVRIEMKTNKLGGYDIPEVDYSPELMKKEFTACGSAEIKILPHNLMNHLLIKSPKISLLNKIIFLFFQIILTWIMPPKFSYKNAGTFIGIAKKSLTSN